MLNLFSTLSMEYRSRYVNKCSARHLKMLTSRGITQRCSKKITTLQRNFTFYLCHSSSSLATEIYSSRIEESCFDIFFLYQIFITLKNRNYSLCWISLYMLIFRHVSFNSITLLTHYIPTCLSKTSFLIRKLSILSFLLSAFMKHMTH